MRKIMPIGLACIIVLSGLQVTSATWIDCDCPTDVNNDCCSLISLPSDYVTMVAEYGTESYFDTTFDGLSSCYDISNGNYLGWCIQRDVEMTRGTLLFVKLYCSLDPNLPEIWQDEDWDKVNYIINHKLGDKTDVQEAIWYFIGDVPTTRYWALKMIKGANDHGNEFCPKPGEKILVLIDNGENLCPIVQRSMIEVKVPDEGCSSYFWKICPCCWVGYHPFNDKIGDVFIIPEGLPAILKILPLIFALFFSGYPSGPYGAAKLLLKQAVAAILNAAHPKVNYPRTETEIINSVNDALDTLDPDTILTLEDELKGYNNLGSDLCCW